MRSRLVWRRIPRGGGSVDVVEAWVREQRLRLCEAEHRRAALS